MKKILYVLFGITLSASAMAEEYKSIPGAPFAILHSRQCPLISPPPPSPAFTNAQGFFDTYIQPLQAAYRNIGGRVPAVSGEGEVKNATVDMWESNHKIIAKPSFLVALVDDIKFQYRAAQSFDGLNTLLAERLLKARDRKNSQLFAQANICVESYDGPKATQFVIHFYGIEQHDCNTMRGTRFPRDVAQKILVNNSEHGECVESLKGAPLKLSHHPDVPRYGRNQVTLINGKD